MSSTRTCGRTSMPGRGTSGRTSAARRASGTTASPRTGVGVGLGPAHGDRSEVLVGICVVVNRGRLAGQPTPTTRRGGGSTIPTWVQKWLLSGSAAPEHGVSNRDTFAGTGDRLSAQRKSSGPQKKTQNATLGTFWAKIFFAQLPKIPKILNARRWKGKKSPFGGVKRVPPRFNANHTICLPTPYWGRRQGIAQRPPQGSPRSEAGKMGLAGKKPGTPHRVPELVLDPTRANQLLALFLAHFCTPKSQKHLIQPPFGRLEINETR